MEQVFLSRRNLLTLLSKLDRVKLGEKSTCSLVKNDTCNLSYPQTCECIMITAVENEDYYTEREPGEVLAKDDPSFIQFNKRYTT